MQMNSQSLALKIFHRSTELSCQQVIREISKQRNYSPRASPSFPTLPQRKEIFSCSDLFLQPSALVFWTISKGIL